MKPEAANWAGQMTSPPITSTSDFPDCSSDLIWSKYSSLAAGVWRQEIWIPPLFCWLNLSMSVRDPPPSSAPKVKVMLPAPPSSPAAAARRAQHRHPRQPCPAQPQELPPAEPPTGVSPTRLAIVHGFSFPRVPAVSIPYIAFPRATRPSPGEGGPLLGGLLEEYDGLFVVADAVLFPEPLDERS